MVILSVFFFNARFESTHWIGLLIAFPGMVDTHDVIIIGTGAAGLACAQQLHISFYDVLDEHFYFERNKLIHIEGYWDKLGKTIDRLRKIKRPDDPVLGSLGRMPARERNIFLSYVEGFHAADLSLLGRQGLLSVEETDANGIKGSRKLARPISDTLFLAGEATISGSKRGTVNGALESGLRVAKLVNN